MITVYYKKDDGGTEACVLRPTPLISISHTPLRNKLGKMGASYSITLNGTIIAHEGSPYYLTSGSDTAKGPDGGHNGGTFTQVGSNFDEAAGGEQNRPAEEAVPVSKRLDAILTKQNAIRQLFARDGQQVDIQPISGDGPRITCYPIVESITFEEGTYVDICRFTITLSATTLLDQAGKVLDDGGMFESYDKTETELITEYGGFVEDFGDSWSIEADESFGQISEGVTLPRAYRITRSMSATGRVSYVSGVKKEGWSQAQKFLKKYLIQNQTFDGLFDYPDYEDPDNTLSTDTNIFSAGFLDLKGYKGYNHVRTENIDQGTGTYSITDTWLLAKETDAVESYSISIQTSNDNPYVEVSIDGSIRGLSELPASGYADPTATDATDATKQTTHQRARDKYLSLSNNGQFGVGCDLYKRANNLCEQALNSSPTSISIGSNEFAGEISYNLQFNNRPASVFTGVLSEVINVNDTYPGDIYAVLPVLGRKTGPILQYTGGRSEYRRDLSIEIILDHTDIGYGDSRADLILRKPSINEPIRTEILELIKTLSPSEEPGIRKYFLEAPTESWNPKTGSYALNLSWVYELGS